MDITPHLIGSVPLRIITENAPKHLIEYNIVCACGELVDRLMFFDMIYYCSHCGKKYGINVSLEEISE